MAKYKIGDIVKIRTGSHSNWWEHTMLYLEGTHQHILAMYNEGYRITSNWYIKDEDIEEEIEDRRINEMSKFNVGDIVTVTEMVIGVDEQYLGKSFKVSNVKPSFFSTRTHVYELEGVMGLYGEHLNMTEDQLELLKDSRERKNGNYKKGDKVRVVRAIISNDEEYMNGVYTIAGRVKEYDNGTYEIEGSDLNMLGEQLEMVQRRPKKNRG